MEEDYFAAALEWGESLGVDVVVATMGYQNWYDFSDKDGSDVLDLKIDYAVKHGVVVLIAAGSYFIFLFSFINYLLFLIYFYFFIIILLLLLL